MWRVSSILRLSGLSTPVGLDTGGWKDRGTAVHSAVEAIAQGCRPEVAPEHEPYVEGVRKWFMDFNPTIVTTERRVTSLRQQVTGRLDIVALIEAGKEIEPTVVDVKTGSHSPFHGIQIGGYKMLAQEDDELWQLMEAPYSKWPFIHRLQRLKGAILYLPGNGKYEWRAENKPEDAFLFRASLSLVTWKHANGLMAMPDDLAKIEQEERGDGSEAGQDGAAEDAAVGALGD